MNLTGAIPAPTLCSGINDCKFRLKTLSKKGVHKLEESKQDELAHLLMPGWKFAFE